MFDVPVPALVEFRNRIAALAEQGDPYALRLARELERLSPAEQSLVLEETLRRIVRQVASLIEAMRSCEVAGGDGSPA